MPLFYCSSLTALQVSCPCPQEMLVTHECVFMSFYQFLVHYNELKSFCYNGFTTQIIGFFRADLCNVFTSVEYFVVTSEFDGMYFLDKFIYVSVFDAYHHIRFFSTSYNNVASQHTLLSRVTKRSRSIGAIPDAIRTWALPFHLTMFH